MPRLERNEEREERIRNEAIVDAYDAEEQAMGWFYYLADSMSFPFEAKCVREIRKSPLKLNETVTVIDMVSNDDDYSHNMLAEILFQGRTMGVPLSQLEPINIDDLTRQVIEDWHYWVGRGYLFG